MGFRFRRTIKVAPGVKLNIGKKGISTSVGKRGTGVTFGSKGTAAHISIPGTGMSYTTNINKQKQNQNSTSSYQKKSPQKKSSGCGCGSFLGGLVLFIALSLFLGIYAGIAVIVVLFIIALAGNKSQK